MVKKLLFWIDQDFTHFGIAKFMQEKYDYEMYAIYDVYEGAKQFFLEQNMVNFNKIWFYRDIISKLDKEVDIDYLINFEQKYKIDLWKLCYSERSFYKYNRYYQFSDNEILSILQLECKFFEKILDDIKPNVLIIKITDWHHNHLLYEMCKSKKIKLLMLEPSRYANRCTLLKEEINSVNYTELENFQIDNPNEVISEFREQQKEYTEKMKEWLTKLRISKLEKIKASIQFFLIANNHNYRKTYTNYGKTKFRILIKEIILILKMRYRELFINKNLIKKINLNNHFVYYPLHVEPERIMLIGAPFFTSQIELIKNISKSLPINYKLYVKEHPLMKIEGWRKLEFYKEVMKFPNVYFLHPSVNNIELIRNSSVVATISGTSAYEGLLNDKCIIVFSEEEFPDISSIYKIKNLHELPEIIKSSLKNKPNKIELSYYLYNVQKKSFQFDWQGFRIFFRHEFYYGGNLADSRLSSKKIELTLEKYRKDFENAVQAHVNIINEDK